MQGVSRVRVSHPVRCCRPDFSASTDFASPTTSAAVAKNLFTIAHSRLEVMPAWLSKLPSSGGAGFHFAGVTGGPDVRGRHDRVPRLLGSVGDAAKHKVEQHERGQVGRHEPMREAPSPTELTQKPWLADKTMQRCAASLQPVER